LGDTHDTPYSTALRVPNNINKHGGDPGHPTVTVQVGKTIIPRVLVDLGAAINIMILETLQLLQLQDKVRETRPFLSWLIDLQLNQKVSLKISASLWNPGITQSISQCCSLKQSWGATL
jgi:hypothetical protein